MKSNKVKERNNNNSTQMSNEIIGLSASTQSTRGYKIAADVSTKSSVNLSVKANEVDCPEELHFFYLKIFKNNKSLAYKFENQDYEDNINNGSFEF
jgi:hypothetical protein